MFAVFLEINHQKTVKHQNLIRLRCPIKQNATKCGHYSPFLLRFALAPGEAAGLTVKLSLVDIGLDEVVMLTMGSGFGTGLRNKVLITGLEEVALEESEMENNIITSDG